MATGAAIGGVCASLLTWWATRKHNADASIQAIQTQVSESVQLQSRAASSIRALKQHQEVPQSTDALTAWMNALQHFFLWAGKINLVAETSEYLTIPSVYRDREIVPYLKESFDDLILFVELLRKWPLSEERGFLKHLKPGDFRNLIRVVLRDLPADEAEACRLRIQEVGLGSALLKRTQSPQCESD